MTLAETMRGEIHDAGVSVLRTGFMARLRDDMEALVRSGPHADKASLAVALAERSAFARALSTAAGVLGFDDLRNLADGLVQAVTTTTDAAGSFNDVERASNALLAFIKRA